MSIRLTLLRLNEQSLALCPLKCLALLMNFLDKIAMKAALQRLVEAGVAPKSGKPIDYDTAATPGNTSGTQVLLLTDEALYPWRTDVFYHAEGQSQYQSNPHQDYGGHRSWQSYDLFSCFREVLFRLGSC